MNISGWSCLVRDPSGKVKGTVRYSQKGYMMRMMTVGIVSLCVVFKIMRINELL
jgi:hypothetical protein